MFQILWLTVFLQVNTEYSRLSGRIEQELRERILRSSDKREEIEGKLEESHQRISFLQRLVAIHHHLEASRAELQADKYLSVANHLNQAARSMDEIGRSGCDARVFRALKSELAQLMGELTLRLQEEWAQFIVWSPRVIPENPSLESLLKIELRVSNRSGSSANGFSDIVAAMKSLPALGVWEQKIASFGQKLLKTMIKPLIATPGLKAACSSEKGEQILRLVRSKDTSLPSHIRSVYSSVPAILSFVRQVDQEWMLGLGEVICPDMCDLITKHCLAAAVPRTPSELQSYGEIASKTADFEKSLMRVGLVEEGFCQLSNYTQNVNTHFAAQKCQDLLAKAREVLMKPIHNTVSVTNSGSLQKLSELQVSGVTPSSAQEGALQSQSKEADLSSFVFTFPPCTISGSVEEFVNLLYKTLNECCHSSAPSTAVQLFLTARNMVELFCAVLPSHHKSTITQLPRMAAVQHNNCMYLVHHLVTLGHQFHFRLPPPLNTEVTTFIDQVPYIRQLGEQCFLSEMKKQCGSILECLQSFGGFDDVSCDEKCEDVRRGIRQALLQVTQLSKVYAEVLPSEIHHKAVGALLNALVEHVVNGVLALEDISADDSTELHSIVTLIVDKGPQALSLGSEEGEPVSTYCTSWKKMEQLGTVLDASLQEIVELWDSGSGPLALQLSPVELRGLVKALFQNTERRAAALSKITL